MHYQTAKGWLEEPTARAKVAARKAKAAQDEADADAQEKSANLALVSGSQVVHVPVRLHGGDRRRAATRSRRSRSVRPRSSPPSGPSKMRHGFWCKEVISRTGQRCWVTEEELKQFSNM